MSSKILRGLTPEQREAVTHIEGPLLVLAGPGSGKTRVITHRIAYLLDQGVPDEQILGITFTNKAANEMAERLERLVPGHRVWLGTFHKFCVRVLRRYGQRAGIQRNFVIYDTRDRQDLLRQVMEELKIDRTALPPRRVEAIISRAKNDFLLPDDFQQRASSIADQHVARIYARYQERLREQNALDFDDLLLVVAELLQGDSELRVTLDRHLRFVLVDEYQDTNEVQYQIVKLLSREEPHLCVTGDPDQSIYGWRGANIRNILRFEQDYPECRVVWLEQNFRSTVSILEAANRLIRHNRMRKEKVLRPVNPEGKPVEVRAYGTERLEAEAIAAEIKAAVDSGRRRYGDFAIFCRISALTRTLEQALRARGVPHQILSGVAFFERMEIKDVLAYLRLLVNPRDNVAFLRALKSPPRGVGETSIQRLLDWAQAEGIGCLEAAARATEVPGLRSAQRKALQQFAELFAQWSAQQDTPLRQRIARVLAESGYEQWLRGQPEGEERVANIEELLTAAEEFERDTGSDDLAEFLATSALTTDLDRWDQDQGAVSLMTLHAAKGLEFPVVYIVAVEDGILPHARADGSNEELEEERRLLFVGVTRAQEELYLSYARTRAFRGRTEWTIPSPFVAELGVPVIEGDEPPQASDVWEFAEACDYGTSSHRSSSRRGRTNRSGTSRRGSKRKRPSEEAATEGTSTSGSWSVGSRVRHKRYGVGYVVALSGSGPCLRVEVEFQRHGKRSFLAAKAKLEVLS